MFTPFDVLFEEANSQTILYHDKIIHRYYSINKVGKYILRFSNISRNSKYFQCIIILFNNCKGKMVVQGDEMPFPDGSFPKILFWEDDFPKNFEIMFHVKEGSIIICNGSDPLGTKKICHHLTKSCAMLIETIGNNKFRFHCNDHEHNDDFEDFVFDMEVVEKN